MEEQIKRLEAVCARLEKVALGAGAVEEDPDVPPAGYLAMKEVYDAEGKQFISLWDKIDGGAYAKLEPPTGAQKLMETCMETVLKVLATTSKCKKPDMATLQAACKPMAEAIDVADKTAKTRKKNWRVYDDYHVVLFELCQSFNWIYMKPPNLPGPFFASQMDSVNTAIQGKIWKKRKDEQKDEIRLFMKTAKDFGEKVAAVIKEHYKVELSWSGTEDFAMGKAAPAGDKKAPAAAEEEVNAAKQTEKKEKQNSEGFAAELTKGLAVTAGLKKVKKEQRNKYSGEKIKGTVSGASSKAKIKKKKDAKRARRGQTWYFEDYQNKSGTEMVTLEEDNADYDMRKGIFIASAINSVFLVKCKLKSIVLDGCKKTQIQIDGDLVSTLELVNCRDCKVYINGAAPSIQVDKCDSPTIYLNTKCWATDAMLEKDSTAPRATIIYANCSAANLTWRTDDGESTDPEKQEWSTFTLPEQFKVTGGEKGVAGIEVVEHSD